MCVKEVRQQIQYILPQKEEGGEENLPYQKTKDTQKKGMYLYSVCEI